jgi:hypothetical protein
MGGADRSAGSGTVGGSWTAWAGRETRHTGGSWAETAQPGEKVFPFSFLFSISYFYFLFLLSPFILNKYIAR